MIKWLKRIIYSDNRSARDQASPSASSPSTDHELISRSNTYAHMGEISFEKGKLREAAECYRAALNIHPENASALAGLGLVYLKQEMPQEAENYLRQAIALPASPPVAHYLLGLLAKGRNQFPEAIGFFRKSLELKPDAEVNYLELSHTYFLAGDLRSAKDTILKGISANPNSPEFHLALGNINYYEQDTESAIACYETALKLQPDASVYLNLGRTLHEAGKTDKAIECYQKALALDPSNPDAFFNFGSILSSSQRDVALECFRKVLAVQPHNIAAKTKLIYLQMQQCEWSNLAALVADLRRENLELTSSLGNQPAPLEFLSIPGITADELKISAERWTQHEFKSLAALRSRFGLDSTPHRKSGDKISIGYLSSDFRNHAVSFLMARVFELHDRSRFHVTAYSYSKDDGSVMRQRLERAFDEFIDISGVSNGEAAKIIHNNGTDILIDLVGYTGSNNRSGIVALRPATIQVNYLGFPGTMGADFIDYMIADHFTIPPEKQDSYSERIAYMPVCFQANDDMRPRPAAPSRTQIGLPEGKFVFCSFNQTQKVNPEIFSIWCQLLAAVPDSILWLSMSSPEAESNLKREASKFSIDPERIIIAPGQPYEQHLARLQCADLFLDTLPFNAGTTCSDALWMGLPVVTCSGDSFASRMAGSLLSAINLPELITYTLEDYFSLAHELATNQTRLQDVKSRLEHNRSSSPLFDSVQITSDLEHLYSEMYQTASGQ